MKVGWRSICGPGSVAGYRDAELCHFLGAWSQNLSFPKYNLGKHFLLVQEILIYKGVSFFPTCLTYILEQHWVKLPSIMYYLFPLLEQLTT